MIGIKGGFQGGIKTKGTFASEALAIAGGLIDGDYYWSTCGDNLVLSQVQNKGITLFWKVTPKTNNFLLAINSRGITDIGDVTQWNNSLGGDHSFTNIKFNINSFVGYDLYSISLWGNEDLIYYLSFNDLFLHDIKIYSQLNNLVNLNLSNNQIVSFNECLALPNSLITIVLNNNQISNFNPSIALSDTLETLSLFGNKLTDFNPSIALPNSLKHLILLFNQITDFNPSIALPNSLEDLSLGQNLIIDFNPTIALPNSLTYLDISSNQIVNFNPTIELPNLLQFLGLRYNQIVEFNPSIALPNSLMVLDLNTNKLTDFNPTIELPIGLLTLDISDNQITAKSASVLSAFAQGLQFFYCNNNLLTSIAVSGYLHDLLALNLTDNWVYLNGTGNAIISNQSVIDEYYTPLIATGNHIFINADFVNH
jgi:Leucine-rich repeat (LRR) protein